MTNLQEKHLGNNISNGLKPIGIGTGLVESLSSYLSRIADALGVSPQTFIDYIIKPVVGSHNKYSSMNSTNASAKIFARKLGEFTEQSDLHLLTMHPFAKGIPNYSLCETHKKWCPECFNSWKKEGKILYEPLLWKLKETEICPVHEILLEKACPHCNQKIPMIHAQPIIAACPKCNGWLGDKTIKNQKSPTSYQIHAASSIFTILESSRKYDNIQPYKNKYNIIRSIKKIKKATAGNWSIFSQLFDIPEASASHWNNKKHHPSFKEQIRLCYNAGIYIIDFMDGNIDKALKNRFANYPSEPEKYQRKKTPTNLAILNLEDIKNYLESILDNDHDDIPSSRAITRQLNIPYKFLRKNFKELISQLVEKREAQQQKRKELRQEKELKELEKVVEQLRRNGYYPSIRRVREALSDPFCLIKPYMKAKYYELIEKYYKSNSKGK